MDTKMENATITRLAEKLRTAHCILDMLATRHLRGGEREEVESLCQSLRNTYLEAFAALRGEDQQ